MISIHPFGFYADVIYSKSVSGVPSENITYSANLNGNTTATVSGSVSTGDIVSLTIESKDLPSGEETVNYTVASGNTTTDIATGLKNAINANTNLAAIGLTSTSSAAVVTVARAGTTYTTSTSGGATETLTVGVNANGNVIITVGGKATNGDAVSIVSHNPLLPSGQQTATYNVGASDTLVDIASGLVTAMTANTNLLNQGITAKNSDAADLKFSQEFAGDGVLPSEASLANVSATDAVPTTKTNTNSLKVTSSASSTLTWDANGNMTSDGTNTYKWDAENRLIEIDYPGSGNRTYFSHDGISRNCEIVEMVSSSIIFTRKFVWCENYRSEERNISDNITNQYFEFGQTLNGVNRYYVFDHLASTRAMTNPIGAETLVRDFSPFGKSITRMGSEVSDFAYCNYFSHDRSSLSLTLLRPYNPNLARWMTRDPIEESEGPNLYTYVDNNPIIFTDPDGLGKLKWCIRTARGVWKCVNKDKCYKCVKSGGEAKVSGSGASAAAGSMGKKIWGNKCVRHDPHQSGQMPHYQHKNGGGSHVFYQSMSSALAPLTAQHYMGENIGSEIVDALNPVSDVVEIINILDGGD